MADAPDPSRNFPAGYVPGAKWTFEDASQDGGIGSFNRSISGATHVKALPVGENPLQLYSMGTPNGQKVAIMLEELLAAGYSEAEYDAWPIHLEKGEQFSSGFVEINPNSKVPALVDRSASEPVTLFESGAILHYLAEKFGAFLPTDPAKRARTMSWLFWQVGAAPFLGGGFAAFYVYAPIKIKFAIDRYAMESKRQYHVLDMQLARTEFVAGDEYTIADMAIYPWYGAVMRAHWSGKFLGTDEYTNVARWAEQIAKREAVGRGRRVNTFPGEGAGGGTHTGEPIKPLPERHNAADFDD